MKKFNKAVVLTAAAMAMGISTGMVSASEMRIMMGEQETQLKTNWKKFLEVNDHEIKEVWDIFIKIPLKNEDAWGDLEKIQEKLKLSERSLRKFKREEGLADMHLDQFGNKLCIIERLLGKL